MGEKVKPANIEVLPRGTRKAKKRSGTTAHFRGSTITSTAAITSAASPTRVSVLSAAPPPNVTLG